MQKKGYRNLQGLIPVMSALCVAVLFAVQIAVSFGHDEQSHPDALEQVCDYCIAKQSLQDLDVASPSNEISTFLAPLVAHGSGVDLPSFVLISAFRSRAPPRSQNT